MSDIPQTPKQNAYYQNMAVKNLYQPMYDVINAQSKWVDLASQWFTQANNEMIKNIREMSGVK